MSINYKNASVILANTNMTTVLTIPVTAVAIVKSVYISNNSTGAVTVIVTLEIVQLPLT